MASGEKKKLLFVLLCSPATPRCPVYAVRPAVRARGGGGGCSACAVTAASPRLYKEARGQGRSVGDPALDPVRPSSRCATVTVPCAAEVAGSAYGE